MRRRAVVTSILASLGIVAIGWQIGAASSASTTVASLPSPVPTPTDSTSGSSTTPIPSDPPTVSSTPSASGTPSGPATATDGTWTGRSVSTPFGSVQVQLTVANGVVTDVTATHLTDAGGRSVQISNRAAPILQREVLASQSAKVSNVSGATYTSQAYLSSVQAALDQAGF